MTDVLPQQAKDMALAQIPMKRIGKPADIAKAVAFLASDALELHHRAGAQRRRRDAHVDGLPRQTGPACRELLLHGRCRPRYSTPPAEVRR